MTGKDQPDRLHEYGMTLVELLVTIVLLGVLIGISLQIVDARARAYLAVLQSDLRNLATAQEAHFQDQSGQPGGARYASNLNQLDFVTSEDVEMVMAGTQFGWAARATHKKRPEFRCALYMGELKAMVQPYEPAIEEGVMACEPQGATKGKGKGKK